MWCGIAPGKGRVKAAPGNGQPKTAYNRHFKGVAHMATDKQKAAGRANLDAGRVRLDDNTPERARQIRQMGQAATAEIRRKRRTMQEDMRMVLSLFADTDILPDDVQGIAKSMAVEQSGKITMQQAIAITQAASAAATGSTQAATFCRDTAGDKPTDKVQTESITAADMALIQRFAAKHQNADTDMDILTTDEG